MDTSLKLYYLNNSNQAVAFPSGGASQAELLDFTLNKTRMGNAPTITGSLEYRTCLDSEWNNGHKFDDVFVEFNGEKFFLKATPSSSKSNEKDVYKHDLNFVSERIVLEHVLVVDCVGNETQNIIPSGSDEMVFFGDIKAFAERINQSMYFSDIGDSCMYQNGSMVPIAQRTLNNDGYYIVVDNGVDTTEEKLISLGETMVLDALKEAVEKFNVPFYFVGRVIHFGSHKSVVLQGYTRGGVLGAGVSGNDLVPYEYGAAHSLLSVQRNNKNVEIITRCSGRGSEDNIPFYYPNPSAEGFVKVEADPSNTGGSRVIIGDYKKFSNSLEINDYIEKKYDSLSISSLTQYGGVQLSDQSASDILDISEYQDNINAGTEFMYIFHSPNWGDVALYGLDAPWKDKQFYFRINIGITISTPGEHHCLFDFALKLSGSVGNDDVRTLTTDDIISINGGEIVDKKILISGTTPVSHSISIVYLVNGPLPYYRRGDNVYGVLGYVFGDAAEYGSLWIKSNGDTKLYNLSDFGISVIDYAGFDIGDKYYKKLDKYIKPQKKLMPSAYRNSDGLKMFYPAKNYPISGSSGDEDADIGETYSGGEITNGNYEITKNVFYVFENLYRRLKQREHIEDFPNIKPTIAEMTNASYKRIDMFSDIAFDTNDTNDGHYDENGVFVYDHPYFFARLRQTNGINGFNLFECAIDEQDMSISMTSGHCAPCEFVIGVDEDTKKNLVQVDDNGDLLRDDSGDVRCGREGKPVEVPQDFQNDTYNNSVWVALKKDKDTYGEVVPRHGSLDIRPSSQNADDGDTFVILHISLPHSYIYAAENKLTKAIIQYMYEHNFEAFDQSLNYSRAYLRDNSGIANVLDDCIKVATKYNGITKQMLVNTYSYKMQSTSPVPEITLGLIEEEDLIEKVAKEGKYLQGVVEKTMESNGASIKKMVRQNGQMLRRDISVNMKNKYISTGAKMEFGDMIIGVSDKTAGIITKGTDGQILQMVGGQPMWVDQS